MGNTMYFTWEPALMVWLQSIMGPLLTQIASFVTMFGEELILIIVMGFLYWCYDKEYGTTVGISIIAGITLNAMLKSVVLRRRPYFDHEEIRCLKPVDSTADIYDVSAQGYSFPSGHSMNSTIVYGSIAHCRKTGKLMHVLAVVLPFLVGLSRVMLGVHYPTDVIAGWAVGALVVFLLPWLQAKFRSRSLFGLLLVLLMLPGVFFCRTNDYFTGLGLMIGFFLAIAFDKRYVNFKNVDFDDPKGILWCLLRLVGGAAVYFILNSILKLPFSESFLESATLGAFLVRTARYCIVSFVAIGVYPMIFSKVEKKRN